MGDDTTGRSRSRWNGLTTDERRRERRRLLVDAAFELLSTSGSAGTTVRSVCGEARLNPRYFYESFTDLDGLLVAVYDRVVRHLAIEIGEAVGALDAEDDDAAVLAAVRATVTFVEADRRRGRILYTEALDNPAVNRRRMETELGLVDLIQQETSSTPAGTADTAVGRLGAAILVGGFSELLTAWLDGRIDLPTEELIEDATEIFLAIRTTTRAVGERRHS